MTERPIILFDLDGTLADTARDLGHTMNVLLERHGRRTLPLERVRPRVGAGARKILEFGFAETGDPASEALLDELFDEFLAYYSAHIADHTVLFPGVREELDRLADGDVKLGVCTNKAETLTHQLLDTLDVARYFPVVIGGDTLPVRKPDPAPLLEAAARLEGTASHTVMIGDSATDINAARAADIASICVTFGYTDIAPHELGATALLDHFSDLPETLSALLPRHFPR